MSAPIVYSFYGVGSGKLGSDTFTNAPFVIMIPADTGGIYTDNGTFGQPALRVSSQTIASVIAIFGRPTAVFNFGLTVTRLNDAIFVGMDVNRLFSVGNAAFASYDLASALGPIGGTQAFDARSYPTTAGDLLFNVVAKGSFQATPAVT